MIQLVHLTPFVALIPLAAAFLNRGVVMAGIGLSGAVFVGSLLILPNSPDRLFLLSQVPVLGLVSALGLTLTRRSDSATSHGTDLASFQKRHATLKSEVAEAERDEGQSLQIYAVAKSLAEALSWKDMAPRLTSGIQKILNAYEFLMYALDENGQWLLLHRRGGWAHEPPISGHVPDRAVLVRPPETTEVVPVLVIPISTVTPEGPQIRGALFVKAPVKEKAEEQMLVTGQEFGEQLGMTLNKALLFSQMEEHSRVDGLTGVLRRQAFMDRLDEELKRSRLFNTPFSVMMVDIDHFKSVNDGHGHAAGDAVLKRLGELLKESVYETDVVGRYGGEEFILLLPKAQADGVLRKAEALRQRIEREEIPTGFGRLRITVSIGVSHHPAHGRTAAELIGQADRALYAAKGNGRNRVIEA